jgi:hypothetical protein
LFNRNALKTTETFEAEMEKIRMADVLTGEPDPHYYIYLNNKRASHLELIRSNKTRIARVDDWWFILSET